MLGMTRRSKHDIFKPNPKYTSHAFSISFYPNPENPIHVLRDPNWKQAMKDEFDALIENNTWDIVSRPPNANFIHSLWIFRVKTKFDGSLERYKVRLIGDGKS